MGIAVEIAFSLAPLRYFGLSCPHFFIHMTFLCNQRKTYRARL